MLDRLSPQDATNLRTEDHGSAMHVAGLAIMDGEPILDTRGQLRLADIRENVERRLHLMPRLRQVLHRPRAGLGPPVWVDAGRFDIRDHVRTDPVDAPGDESALLAKVAKLNEPPLDRSRPLWELRFLTGLADGRVGLLIRLHHVIADGVAALVLIGPLFDAAPDAQPPIRPAWTPGPVPADDQLLTDSLHRRAAPFADAASWLLQPDRWWDRSVKTVGPMLQTLKDGPAPRSVLNGPIGARRRIALVRADLERIRTAAHAHGAKVNDMVLAAVAGGARELLEHHQGRRPRASLRAMVPVSQRAAADGLAGNRVAVIVVPLPLHEPDPVRRLESIARVTAGRKMRPIEAWSRFPSLLAASMHHQRVVNLFTSNLPGPTAPWYFAGARVLELFQLGPVQGNVRLNVGALSYAGGMYLDVVADADSIPDVAVFADGLWRSLAELGAAGS